MLPRSAVVDGIVVALAPPPDANVNLASPTQRHNTTANVVFGVGFVFSTLCFMQYAYVKLRLRRKVDAQLLCLTMGWIFSIAMQAVEIETFKMKLVGVHEWEMTTDNAQKALYYIVSITILNALVTGFCKTSLGLFYCNLFPQVWWKWISWGTLIFVTGYNIAIFFAIILGCHPFEKNWDSDLAGLCINRPALYISKAALEFLSDLMVLVMPIPIIMGLKITTWQKVVLILSLGMSSLTFVTAIIRLYLLGPAFNTDDVTWKISSVLVTMLAESHLIVICATLPTIRQFCSHFAPRLLGEEVSSIINPKGSQSDTQKHILPFFGKGESRKMKEFRQVNEFRRVSEFRKAGKEDYFDVHPGSRITYTRRPEYPPNPTPSHTQQHRASRHEMSAYRQSVRMETIQQPNYIPASFLSAGNFESSQSVSQPVDDRYLDIHPALRPDHARRPDYTPNPAPVHVVQHRTSRHEMSTYKEIPRPPPQTIKKPEHGYRSFLSAGNRNSDKKLPKPKLKISEPRFNAQTLQSRNHIYGPLRAAGQSNPLGNTERTMVRMYTESPPPPPRPPKNERRMGGPPEESLPPIPPKNERRMSSRLPVKTHHAADSFASTSSNQNRRRQSAYRESVTEERFYQPAPRQTSSNNRLREASANSRRQNSVNESRTRTHDRSSRMFEQQQQQQQQHQQQQQPSGGRRNRIPVVVDRRIAQSAMKQRAPLPPPPVQGAWRDDSRRESHMVDTNFF